jgi:hypothetical protein
VFDKMKGRLVGGGHMQDRSTLMRTSLHPLLPCRSSLQSLR